MPRQTITITKVMRGIDQNLDHVIDNLSRPADLNQIIDPRLSGAGVLYWASYYDYWSMGDTFDTSQLGIPMRDVADGISSIDLEHLAPFPA